MIYRQRSCQRVHAPKATGALGGLTPADADAACEVLHGDGIMLAIGQ